ncbi:NADH dehydrogenase (ubiquinone) complex I, assembly factor 6-like isoform X3 [Ptychodera flava]
MIGKMRMQFWREVIHEIYQGTPRQTPVVKELYRAVVNHKLSKRWFTRIIDSREANLDNNNYRRLSEVEDYAENTCSSLLYLTLESLGLQNVHADHAASHIGKSQGIVTLLRATPYHASKRKVYLPMEILIQHGVAEEQIIRGRVDQKLKDVVYDIASQGHMQLEKARSLKKDVPRAAMPAFLVTVPVANYLKKLQKADFNIFHPSLQQRNTMIPFSLWMQSLRKTY